MLNDLIKELALLSATIQASIISSSVTIIGLLLSSIMTLVTIYLTNRGHEKRLLLQINTDNEKRKLDREMQIRKEIYIDLAEAINNNITDFVRISASQKHESNKNDYSSTFAKVHVIGSASLIFAVQELTIALDTATLEKQIIVRPIRQKEQELENLLSTRSKINTTIEEMHDFLRAQYLNGNMKDSFPTVEKYINFEQTRFNSITQTIKELQKSIQTEQLNALDRIMEMHKDILLKTMPIVEVARKELELDIDMETYKNNFIMQTDKHKQVILHFIHGMNQNN